jgi:hypothetical protein
MLRSEFSHHISSFQSKIDVAHQARLAGASWDSSGGGGRLALATDTALFIVVVKLPYMWAVCQSTMAYVHAVDPRGPKICFWDMATDEMQTRPFKPVVALEASSKHLLIVTEGEVPGQYALVLCDAIGTSLDTKPVRFCPQHVAMTATHILAANGNTLYVWNYCNEEVRWICCSSFCMHAKFLEKIVDVETSPTVSHLQGGINVLEHDYSPVGFTDSVLMVCHACWGVWRHGHTNRMLLRMPSQQLLSARSSCSLHSLSVLKHPS